MERTAGMLAILGVLLLIVPTTHAGGASAGRSLLQAATGAAQQATITACPISADNVLLNFTEVKTSCVTSGGNSTAFCDSCSCAIFSAFTPALQATGLVNTTSASDINRGVEVVGSCVNTFLAQFVAADVDVQALVALGSCQYADDQVPACLQQRVTALSNRLTTGTDNATAALPPPVPAPSPPTLAASGGPPPGDYAPDVNEASEIVDGIGNNGTDGSQSPTTTSPAASSPPSPGMVSVIIEPGASNNPLTDPSSGTIKVSPITAAPADNGGGSPSSATASGPNAARLTRPGLAGGVAASLGAATLLLLALA